MDLQERNRKLKQILHRNGSKLVSYTFLLELFSEKCMEEYGTLRDMRDAVSLLSQVFYWQDKMIDSKKRSQKTIGWAFYKTDLDFQAELYMSRRTFDRSRKILKSAGYLETKIFQIKNLAMNHYKLTDKLYEDILVLENRQIKEAHEKANSIKNCPPVNNENTCSQSDNNSCPDVCIDMPRLYVSKASIQKLLPENTSYVTSDNDIPF